MLLLLLLLYSFITNTSEQFSFFNNDQSTSTMKSLANIPATKSTLIYWNLWFRWHHQWKYLPRRKYSVTLTPFPRLITMKILLPGNVSEKPYWWKKNAKNDRGLNNNIKSMTTVSFIPPPKLRRITSKRECSGKASASSLHCPLFFLTRYFFYFTSLSPLQLLALCSIWETKGSPTELLVWKKKKSIKKENEKDRAELNAQMLHTRSLA